MHIYVHVRGNCAGSLYIVKYSFTYRLSTCFILLAPLCFTAINCSVDCVWTLLIPSWLSAASADRPKPRFGDVTCLSFKEIQPSQVFWELPNSWHPPGTLKSLSQSTCVFCLLVQWLFYTGRKKIQWPCICGCKRKPERCLWMFTFYPKDFLELETEEIDVG